MPHAAAGFLQHATGAHGGHDARAVVTCSPEKMTLGCCQTGSSAIFFRMKKRRCAPRRAMNAVPGVMQLLSNRSSSPSGSPRRTAAARACVFGSKAWR